MNDERLVGRVRELLSGRAGMTERSVFGTRGFLLRGHVCVCVHDKDLLVRLAADDAEAALAEKHTKPVAPMGRPMTGWVLVAGRGVAKDAALAEWVARGVAYAATLPPKK